MSVTHQESAYVQRGRRSFVALAACCLTGAIALGLCMGQPAAWAGEGAGESVGQYGSQVDRSLFDDPEALASYTAQRAQRDADVSTRYAAEVIMLEDGTQVQPIPNDRRGYNVGVIRAGERGCTACHTLEDAIEWCPISHNGLSSYGDDPLSVNTCIACHDGQQEPLFNRPGIEMSDVIHNSHMGSPAFVALNGSCVSCHEIDAETNTMPLWDEVKYDRMQGFTEVADVAGSFSFDQDTLTDNDRTFYMTSAATDPNGVPLHSSSDDSVLENLAITIDGLVDNPIDLKLVDIPEDQLVTRILKLHCSANGIGDALIANAEFTGVTIDTLCEMVGAQGDALKFICEESQSTFSLEWLRDHEALIVFQMNGENLPSELGYPCSLFIVGTGANTSRHYVTGIEFLDSADVAKFKHESPGTEIVGLEDEWYNKPAAAFLNVRDGQIFEGADAIVFEGFADAFDERVVEVKFSLDRGKTWQVCETPDTTIDRWVHWTYTLEGLEPGSYDLRVQVTTDTGRVMAQDLNTVFHVK